MPGVVAVFTAADLTDVSPIPGGIGFPRPDGSPAPKTDRPLLAADRVRFVGEPVALVLAETHRSRQGRGRGGDGGLSRTAAGHRRRRRAGTGRAEGVGRCARQHRLPVEARRCRGDRRSVAQSQPMLRGCSSPSRASPPIRWSRAAPGRRSAATAAWWCTPRTSRRTTCATAWPTATSTSRRREMRVLCERCRWLVRHEVRRAAGIRPGRLGRAQDAAPGALDFRSHRGLPHRRAGARDAHHGRNWRWMPTTSSPR